MKIFIKMLTSRGESGILNLALFSRGLFGGIAQLARALGSYPSCPRFESRCRYHAARAAPFGALVKRLRHRPFTAVTWVRFPYASPTSLLYGGIAQLVERPPHTRKVTDSSSVVSTKRNPSRICPGGAFSYPKCPIFNELRVCPFGWVKFTLGKNRQRKA